MRPSLQRRCQLGTFASCSVAERLETKIELKFDALYRFLIQAVLGMMAIMVGGFATLLAAVIWV